MHTATLQPNSGCLLLEADRADNAQFEPLIAFLRAKGYLLFIRFHNGVENSLDVSFHDKMAHSDIVMVFYSDAARTKTWVSSVLSEARTLNKPVLMVRLHPNEGHDRQLESASGLIIQSHWNGDLEKLFTEIGYAQLLSNS